MRKIKFRAVAWLGMVMASILFVLGSPKNTVWAENDATTTEIPVSTGVPVQTEQPQTTQQPEESQEPEELEVEEETEEVEQEETVGLNQTASGKWYYVLKNKKHATGYREIDGEGYYFSKTTTYAVTKKWKYVKWKGKKYKFYFGKNGKRKKDVSSLLKKNTQYMLEVNLNKNMVMVYAKDGKNGYIIPVKAMICSSGMPGHRTITGTYSISRSGRWHVLRYSSIGQYATRISGSYMFHSVVYSRYGNSYSLQPKEYNKLGKSASHGCIRLQVKDAKWIFDHCYQCRAHLYYGKKSEKTPIEKPKKVKIGKTKSGAYYDPTDPSVS